jgi:hypothetical protein
MEQIAARRLVARKRHLRKAHRLFIEMGAKARAEWVANELAARGSRRNR